MGLVIVGVSHKTAPVELRERLALPAEKLGEALRRLRALPGIQEAVVLSTCNRFEVYARPGEDREQSLAALRGFLRELYGRDDIDAALYAFEAERAVHHLFRVAAGLDSLVVGETEVLGQVKNAYAFAHGSGATGKITNGLFQRALFVGKQVRNRTTVSEGASSVGSIAVQLAERIFGALESHRILLLGAGKMAEVTARHLLSQKAGRLKILNRTRARAEELAKLLNGEAGSLEELEAELHVADIVVCSTSAEKPFITRAAIAPIMRARRGRSLYFIDIAVPRNVDPSVHELDNVYVYNIDDLQALVNENMRSRQREVGAAESIVAELAAEFHGWVRGVLEGKPRPLRHTVPPERRPS